MVFFHASGTKALLYRVLKSRRTLFLLLGERFVIIHYGLSRDPSICFCFSVLLVSAH